MKLSKCIIYTPEVVRIIASSNYPTACIRLTESYQFFVKVWKWILLAISILFPSIAAVGSDADPDPYPREKWIPIRENTKMLKTFCLNENYNTPKK